MLIEEALTARKPNMGNIQFYTYELLTKVLKK